MHSDLRGAVVEGLHVLSGSGSCCKLSIRIPTQGQALLCCLLDLVAGLTGQAPLATVLQWSKPACYLRPASPHW